MLAISSIEFVSVEFALFFLLFLPVYWVAARSRRAQNALLLAASLGWLAVLNIRFALVLVGVALFVAFMARRIYADRKHARIWFTLGVVGVVGHLALYKYAHLLPALGNAQWLLPLGLSYYTFQSISYMHEVYTGRIQPWAWNEVPLFLGFFPTITSGPIWRAGQAHSVLGTHAGADSQLPARFCAPRRTMQRPALALVLAVLGVVKVWWLSGWVEEQCIAQVFTLPAASDAPGVLLAVYAAAMQLYLNFSGHADLAIALGMLLGFSLPPNFAAPFWAHNIREFWGRWHISLSTWIRDYIYIPLGGSRHGFARTQFNLLAAMLLSGIWHGASGLFALWGLAHGLALVALNCGDKLTGGRERLAALGLPGRALGRFFTLSFVAFTFLVFRCATLDEMRDVLAVLASPDAWGVPTASTLAGVAALAALWLAQPLVAPIVERSACALERWPRPLWCLPLAAAALLLLVMAPSGVPGFLYANF
ncbi:MAG: MBOAT family protein [Ottowia sp.]|nr:MBOAT family protein [Ottowia sp.]